uniref:Uncharacterized protein n=1 Tax=Daphnia galeata TaxID=27404 RepID=A0A8J2RBR5_9CRUS|nr:unnamed protein product [Daphnia galeata]
MAIPFFQKEWETITAEELSTARARFAGFIEAVPDKEKVLREVEEVYLSDGALTSHKGPVAKKFEFRIVMV